MILQLLGRSHLLLLHLPIGILLLAFLLEWVSRLKWQEIPRPILSLVYGFGAVFSLLTSISGYVLSQQEDYNSDLISNHQWSGIFTVFMVFVLFFVSKSKSSWAPWFSTLTALSIAITGHLGGSITHGENFLMATVDTNPEIFSPLEIRNPGEAFFYEDVIQYIFNTKCNSCHGPKKIKGKLRLDSKEYLQAGGKSGKNLLAAIDNEILRRIHLPKTHKNHMPPERKPQLEEYEINILENWIKSGARFNQQVAKILDSINLVNQIQRLILASTSEKEGIMGIVPAYLPDAEGLEPISSDILASLDSLDFVALPAGKNSPFLEINTVNIDTMQDLHWASLEKIRNHIVRLKLSGQPLDESSCLLIGKMKNLVRLYVDQCNLRNEYLAHFSSLNELSYINLSQNSTLTNEGIKPLNSLARIDKIIAFQTAVRSIDFKDSPIVLSTPYVLPILASDTLRIPDI